MDEDVDEDMDDDTDDAIGPAGLGIKKSQLMVLPQFQYIVNQRSLTIVSGQ